ncbi:hypothetical protein L3X38_033973 [Prunus dulcis]|uniref:Integrase catalytic domain-containing protein n=1 Tax=Prunus dulcis TaxID=3755 RepID=A0AAD4VGY6_PRUDU|nr:hypothetical protein L3X38_033973 [Prunus dulcis]
MTSQLTTPIHERDCAYCGDPRHTRETYFKLHGYPEWWATLKDRTQPDTTHNDIGYGIHSLDKSDSMSWIIDSGATDHMTCSDRAYSAGRTPSGSGSLGLLAYFQQYGIIHETTCPQTPQQNGVAERRNRHLLETTRALLIGAYVPHHHWDDAIVTAVHLINHMPFGVLTFKLHYKCLGNTDPCPMFWYSHPKSLDVWPLFISTKINVANLIPVRFVVFLWVMPLIRKTTVVITFRPDRYKARLVAKGYTQTYGVNYEETLAPIAKLNTVRVLLFLIANLDWPFQFDVKNVFLHGELMEEVYMDIPPGYNTTQTGIHQKERVTTLIICVDDMIITGNDKHEISQLQDYLTTEFEMKNPGGLKYFLGIEVARSQEGIFLSQRKYVLDLLTDIGMLGCKHGDTPIVQNHHFGEYLDQVPTNKERYQRLVGRLIYLSHTRPDIAYAMSVVSQFMHSPSEDRMNAVIRILRYLKSAPKKGLMFSKHGHLNIDGYTDADWAGSITDRKSTSGYFTFMGGNLVT